MQSIDLGSMKELNDLKECNPDACPPLHSPHSDANKEQRTKVERKGGGSKVGTLETLKRLRMKLSGQYHPETPCNGCGGDTLHKACIKLPTDFVYLCMIGAVPGARKHPFSFNPHPSTTLMTMQQHTTPPNKNTTIWL